MILQVLSVSQLRNLSDVSLSLSSGLNVLYGDNGAGKTSVLEAIHCLSQMRSFKTRNPRHVINHDADAFLVRGEIVSDVGSFRIGIRRSRNGVSARLNGADVARPSVLAERFPVLVIHPASFSMLTGARAEKRAYLDWGAFYLQPEFRQHWAIFRKALGQRNAALKNRLRPEMITCWDDVLASSAQVIASSRQRYLERIEELLPGLISRFGQSPALSVSYQRGWSPGRSLREQLSDGLASDLARGYTYPGPQRGGFTVRLNEHPIGEIGSRGQIKLATIVFKLAQLQIFMQASGRRCVLLLDDLDSELDATNFSTFLEVIQASSVQTILTTLHPEKFERFGGGDVRLFHVEHGRIEQVL